MIGHLRADPPQVRRDLKKPRQVTKSVTCLPVCKRLKRLRWAVKRGTWQWHHRRLITPSTSPQFLFFLRCLTILGGSLLCCSWARPNICNIRYWSNQYHPSICPAISRGGGSLSLVLGLVFNDGYISVAGFILIGDLDLIFGFDLIEWQILLLLLYTLHNCDWEQLP